MYVFTVLNEFLLPILTVKFLFKHLSKDSSARIRCPPMGERRGAWLLVVKNHDFTDSMKKIRLRLIRSVRCEGTIWNEAPAPFSRPPPLLLRGREGGGGLVLARTDHYENRDECLKRADYFKRSSFDKRWLKYTVRMEDCAYLCF